jgi:hypothetical protein
MLYTLPQLRFELTTSVVIGTDYIGSCKSNYFTITAMLQISRLSNLIKVRCLLYLLFFGDTQHLTTSCLGSCHVTFHLSLTIQSYAGQLTILTNGTIAPVWSVENMNTDMTPYGMSLDVSVSPMKKETRGSQEPVIAHLDQSCFQ